MAISKVNSPYTKIQDVPDVPTIGTATEGAESAEVAFTPATTGGRAYQYRALSNPGSIEAVGFSSPITVEGLTADTTYNFQVRAETNTGATNGYSDASNDVVPTSSTSLDLLETVTLTSSASSITFSNLSTTYGSTYKHLQIWGVARTDRASFANDTLRLEANADSGTNYGIFLMVGNGSSVNETGGTQPYGWFGRATASLSASNAFGGAVLDILDFADTSKNTSFISSSGMTDSNLVDVITCMWNNTDALETLELYSNTGSNFLSGTQYSLYGVKG